MEPIDVPLARPQFWTTDRLRAIDPYVRGALTGATGLIGLAACVYPLVAAAGAG
jgi:hypothetical protein